MVASTCSLRICLQHLPLEMPSRQSMHRAQHATTLGLAPQQASHPRPQPGPAHAALTSLVDTTLTAHSMSLPVFRHSLTLPKEPRPSVSTTMYCGAGQAQQAGWKRMALDRTAAVSSAAHRVRLGSPVVRGSATQGGQRQHMFRYRSKGGSVGGNTRRTALHHNHHHTAPCPQRPNHAAHLVQKGGALQHPHT